MFVRVFASFVIFFVALDGAALAGEYCAVRVHIKGSAGSPLGASLRVFGSDGRLFKQAGVVSGVAEICDLGFDVYRIEIGPESDCDHITVRNVQDSWPIPQEILVVPSLCGGDSVRSPGCVAALRLVAPGGLPAKDAMISGYGPDQRADSYGRAWFSLKPGYSTFVTINYLNFKPTRVRLTCERPFADTRETVVIDGR
jgi:hypothetical protein